MALLEVDNLVTEFATDEGLVRAVDGVSFSVEPGATVGIVGESGCGKSVTALSIMRLLPQPMGRIASGEIRFQDRDLAQLPIPEMEKIRGCRIGMVFQEPMTALNPVHTIGRQLTEGMLLHKICEPANALRAAADLLDRVGIPSPEVRLGEYPHQLSGGMRQRVVIAMALACRPSLLIADEPTTALDVTIQAQILELIKDLQAEMGMAVIMITHDLGVIAETCDQVVVMYAGKVAERGTVFDIFDRPAHPYSRGLLQSIPRLDTEPKSRLGVIEGMVPGLRDLPLGCRFENRCEYAMDRCRELVPVLEQVADGHSVSCIRWRDL
ncbi:ABC transporter ATP-binding protein [Haliea sp. E1-2-M8]|uniref:ABC transporter ATP-binding protein n=1 Tax=Haliea sp. E1-2-M8 TaxID=3064706 RepID=UPI00271FD620|nr:ABC transporter ATP-binding protein [Haliea sp. E1-2-M8]MDO8861049.1 ABC transporter ATP-binding protein [Haliea sp. E1-2-M8]